MAKKKNKIHRRVKTMAIDTNTLNGGPNLNGGQAQTFRSNLVNPSIGLNSNTNVNAGHFKYGYAPTYVEYEGMYGGGSDLASTIVNSVVDESLRYWRKWVHPDKAVIEKIEESEKVLEVRQVVRKALIDDRLYGGAAIIPIFKAEDAPETLRDPQDFNSIKEGDIDSFRHIDRWSVYKIITNIMDIMDPAFLSPRYMVLAYGGQPISLSRMVLLQGEYLPLRMYQNNMWFGKSALQDVYSLLLQLATVETTMADLSKKATFDVLKLANLKKSISDPQGALNLQNRMNAMNIHQSAFKATVIDKEDDYIHFESDLRFYTSASEWLLKRISGKIGIPISILTGSTPSGMNATGAVNEDVVNYIRTVEIYRESKVRPTLEAVDNFLLRTTFGEDYEKVVKDLRWEFAVPKFVDETEDSTLKTENLQRITDAIAAGLLDPDEAKEIMKRDRVFSVPPSSEHTPDLEEQLQKITEHPGSWK